MSIILKEGDPAPLFESSLPDGSPFALSSLKGKKVILYFYPKDNTPGCTKEACDFRDHWKDFQKSDVVVLGISRDSHKSHHIFKSLFSLPFTLLSDENGEISKAYGTWVEKSMFGKKYFGLERATFLIDETGKIQKIWRKVKVLGHVQKVLQEALSPSQRG
ncbi:MAG: thioredoxin-dependent thiol peroxidase [Proteobacteria bacterium]|nr:thioredoxin-dependent thiol peroxidase [Pseudomonadota bacterium]